MRVRSLLTSMEIWLGVGMVSMVVPDGAGVGRAKKWVTSSEPFSSISDSVDSFRGSSLHTSRMSSRTGITSGFFDSRSRMSSLSTARRSTSFGFVLLGSGHHTRAWNLPLPSSRCRIQMAGSQSSVTPFGLISKKFFLSTSLATPRKGHFCWKSVFNFSLFLPPKGKSFLLSAVMLTSGDLPGSFSTCKMMSTGSVPMAPIFHFISLQFLPMAVKALSSWQENCRTIMSSSCRGASMVRARRLMGAALFAMARPRPEGARGENGS
mmetsp:Transcript_124918/g.388883  ORF Transcript_124918/g.388883 Transcript_124918/m.388883 type:complete len:265 (+) Transcript_124918:754-1548(+)